MKGRSNGWITLNVKLNVSVSPTLFVAVIVYVVSGVIVSGIPDISPFEKVKPDGNVDGVISQVIVTIIPV